MRQTEAVALATALPLLYDLPFLLVRLTDTKQRIGGGALLSNMDIESDIISKNIVGSQTKCILGQEKTRSAQNRSDWGQAYVVKCKNTKKCVQFEVRLIYYVYCSA